MGWCVGTRPDDALQCVNFALQIPGNVSDLLLLVGELQANGLATRAFFSTSIEAGTRRRRRAANKRREALTGCGRPQTCSSGRRIATT
jgi:hypothetical protein